MSTNTIKQIGVFGSTGSIGTQTLEVIKNHPHLFSVSILVAHSNAQLLIKQAKIFHPKIVVIGKKNLYKKVVAEMTSATEVLAGEEGIITAAASSDYDMMVAAISGCAGLASIITAIDHLKTIALANKEAMVVAGKLIMDKIKQKKTTLLPIDSEHSAILQCLVGEATPYNDTVDALTLTASGGPFLGKKRNFLVNVKKNHALEHPIWKMGIKISIDSATLMNKGLEMIEARWLFNIIPKKIHTLIHPESIIHSFVSFKDASIKAQLATQDMKIPIMYALSYPKRITSTFNNTFNLYQLTQLNFEIPDESTFRCLSLAKQVLLEDSINSCVLNIANEVAIEAFAEYKIGFLDIAEIIEKVLNKHTIANKHYTLDELLSIHVEIRKLTSEIIKEHQPIW